MLKVVAEHYPWVVFVVVVAAVAAVRRLDPVGIGHLHQVASSLDQS